MKTTKYDKLVGDKIPELLRKKWIDFTSHVANQEEYREKLIQKLQEEVQELISELLKPDTNKQHIANEIADILNVIEYLLKVEWITPEELNEAKERKDEKRGWFDKKIILEQTTE